MNPLTIILITHNRLEYTKQTLESLAKTVPNADLFIYDNASDEPGMKDFLAGLAIGSDNIKVVLGSTNLGWGSAVNKAMNDLFPDGRDYNQTQYVLLSNNDCIYQEGWYETCLSIFDDFADLGILGVWKHRDHSTITDHGNFLERDNMPAVGWLMRLSVMQDVGPIEERGPCDTKGGNGEDSDYVEKMRDKGYLVGAPREDVGLHITGY